MDLIQQLGKTERSDKMSLKLLHISDMLYGVLNYYVMSVKRLHFLLNSMGGFLTIKSSRTAVIDLIKTQNSASKIL